MSPRTTRRERLRWLIALDIDGTVMCEDGTIQDDVRSQINRAASLGHEVMIATGRSVAMTLPVVDRLGITPKYIVCSNGAITLKRDPSAPLGYVRDLVETFDPSEVLTTVRANLRSANYAVEDEDGLSRYTGSFPDGALGAGSEKVEFDDLLTQRATRVVVISPEHGLEDFLEIVDEMGLHKVSYNVGWTAWLDIAPDGVNKSTALERVRGLLKVPRSRVLAVGDGRNDIDMLEWASVSGRGVAMGQAPDEVKAAANELTASDLDGGVARLLERL
ncbi:Cof subfamily protein (haloacid dehalogenase superfamily) [Glaciihabitans tibetensis]|uniref:Cof subfamily protein (Haloacid dehalogenase superfamily) n=1 Tax=Glaciihabitans tibetensis TaxID=1266600 RepID=A0A2T0V9T8_9MICO|nr:HAD family hydrolase [Glaciihabitans tibetensis]PRY66959.1 Cof subfamily protein (haloacid dehalogenase superfamily) [Glaciihabitans tibetensis]